MKGKTVDIPQHKMAEDLESQIRISYQSLYSPYPAIRKKTSINELSITRRVSSDVQHAHRLLNDYIEVLDHKVGQLIEKHEAQFLVAYRNHAQRVRQQMQQIRKKSLSNAKSATSHTQVIEQLEKKLIIFREESLKMFQKLTEKETLLKQLEAKISEITQENQHLRESLKTLTKRNKYLEGSKNQEKTFELTKPINVNPSQIQIRYSINRPTTSKTLPQQRYIKSQSTKYLSNDLSSLKVKIDSILHSVPSETRERLKYEIDDYMRSQQPRKNRSFTSTKTESMHLRKQQMQQYFCRCVQTVRKQISRRKKVNSLNFLKDNCNITIEEFKKVDFFRLLELVITHDKVIRAIHNELFG